MSDARPSQPPREPVGGEGQALLIAGLFLVALVLLGGGAMFASFMQARARAARAMAAYQAQLAISEAQNRASIAAASIERGVALMSQFEPVQAEAVFEEACRKDPTFVARLDRAIAQLNQSVPGAQEKAIEALRRLIADHPAHDEVARAHYCMGLGLAYLGRPDEALPAFEEAARRRPDDGAVQYQLGQMLEQLGRLDDALPRYERALTLDPHLRSALLGIQRVHARAGRDAEAAKALERFMALEDDPRSRLTEFKYTRMGPLSEAIPVDGPRAARPVFGAPNAPGAPGAPAAPAAPGTAVAPALAIPGDPGAAVAVIPMGTSTMPLAAPDIDMASPLFKASELSPDFGEGVPIAVDLDSDQRADLFVAGAADAEGRSIFLRQDQNAFSRQENDLTAVAGVRFASFADVDGDGLADALLVTSKPSASRLMRQSEPGRFVETARWEESDDALWVDLDHDGDLDLAMAVGGAPRLLMNRGAEGFESLDAAASLPGAAGACTRIAAGDLDGDGRMDLALLGDSGAQFWINDGFWRWRRDATNAALERTARRRMVISEMPETGEPLVVALADGAAIAPGATAAPAAPPRAAPTGAAETPPPTSTGTDIVGAWVLQGPRGHRNWALLGFTAVEPKAEFLVMDLVGNGTLQILISQPGGATARRLDGSQAFAVDSLRDAARTVVVAGSPPRPWIVEWTPAQPRLLRTGATTPPRFVAVEFRGRIDASQSMRSNADGIGVRWASRLDGRWNGGWVLRNSSGPGQGRQPTLIGIGYQDLLGALFVDWPDGVIQSEFDLRRDAVQRVKETQRQISSCPVIFAWDGAGFRFETDCLGVGGLGYLAGVERRDDGGLRPIHAPPRPRESVRLRSALEPRDGSFEIRLTEPMEEACYLDAARLVEWRLPPGWEGALDERMAIHGPEPSGEARFFRRSQEPREARVRFGASESVSPDALDALARIDGRAVEFGAPDPRFIGRLGASGSLELRFDEPIDREDGRPALLVEGWVEYPYSQTTFAMWQEAALPKAPSIDAFDPATGAWVTLVEEIGYPAGMTRESLLPLSGEGIASIPAGCTRLRIRTAMELYLDRLRLVHLEECPQAQRVEHALRGAEVAECGYPERIPRPQKRADFDYGRRAPLWDCRTQPGFYTRFGDCTDLVRAGDGAMAIFGPGEEVRLRFDAAPVAARTSAPALSGAAALAPSGAAAPAPSGEAALALASRGERFMVLQLEGWCKDMDPYTGDGATLEPLPDRADLSAVQRAERDRLHRAFNTRLNGGR